jgi:hypothetical protein
VTYGDGIFLDLTTAELRRIAAIKERKRAKPIGAWNRHSRPCQWEGCPRVAVKGLRAPLCRRHSALAQALSLSLEQVGSLQPAFTVEDY